MIIPYTTGSTTFTNAMWVAASSPAVVELGEGWEVIGQSAFQSTNIISIEIPASLTSIDNFAFLRCDNFTTITFAGISELETIGSRAFQETVLSSIEIPKSVTLIESSAFNSCTSLANVTFAAGSELETIGSAAFLSSDISTITIPPSVTSLYSFVFHGCSKLTSVIFTLDSQLAYIGEEIFYNSGLNSLTIPQSLLTVFNVQEGSEGQTVGRKDGVIVTVIAAGGSGSSGSSTDSSAYNTGLVMDNGECLPKELHTNKIIQGACRVPSSLFTMTKASINVASVPVVRNDKHGSYARYLDRKKGKGPLLTQERNHHTAPIYGNKSRMIGLMPNCHC